MKKLPSIQFWRERITSGDGGVIIHACHAVRNWDFDSNGVFLLYTHAELYGKWDSRRDWRGELTEKLVAREKRMIGFGGTHYFKHAATEYSDDEVWCELTD